MKKIILLSIVTLSSFVTFAQDHKAQDTVKIKWKGSRVWIFDDNTASKKDSIKKTKKHKQDFVHWGGIDLGISMLSTADNKLKIADAEDTTQMNKFLDLNYSKSLYLSLNILEKSIHVYKNYVNIVTGLGFEWSGFNFKRNITLPPNAPYISAANTTSAPDSIKFTKNKLRVAYIKVPVLLELNTNNTNSEKSFHIAGGLEFDYKIGSRSKQVYEINGYEYKIKRKDDYNLATFKYNAVLRVGYGNYFTVFANYALSTLFAQDKGPRVYPINVGVAFNF